MTISMAVTAAFWVWSIEAQVYTLGFAALAWAALVLIRDPDSSRKPLWVGLLHGAAVLGHIIHLIWVVPAVYWMGGNRKAIRRYVMTLGAAVLLPYLLVLAFVIAPGRDAHHIRIWLEGSAALTPDRHWSWHFGGWSGPWIYLKSILPALWGSFWPYGNTPVARWIWATTGLSIVLLVCLLSSGSLKRGKMKTFCWLWLGTYGLFLSSWEPDTLCYRITDVLPLGILLALSLRVWPRSYAISAAFILWITILTTNLQTRILPMHDIQQNKVYQQTMILSKMTPPDSVYIAENTLSWIYLLYFTGRTAWKGRPFETGKLHRPMYVQKGDSWQKVQ
jgi:hypothetical protein